MNVPDGGDKVMKTVDTLSDTYMPSTLSVTNSYSHESAVLINNVHCLA